MKDQSSRRRNSLLFSPCIASLRAPPIVQSSHCSPHRPHPHPHPHPPSPQEERQALLHEGSGSAAVNAFVEVVFDNSDNRFSLENSDEVVLRRTVGSKKDEFFLQRKRATKQEVQSLLEGAGFSKSNPYFMVQQGKIQALCLMSDAQRLELLQQVAGTTLYEDKKAESLVKMQENSQSIEKINSILTDIDDRLGELQGEKEELTVYQSLDRDRRALEYTLYDKELRKARLVLDNVEHQRVEHLREVAHLHEVSKESHDRILNAEAAQKIKVNTLRRVVNQRRHAEQDKSNALTVKTQLKLRCEELQEQLKSMQETSVQNQAELEQLEEEIAAARAEFLKKDETLKQQEEALQDMTLERDQAVRKADGLYAKQGRGKQYSSKEERDQSLRQQIQDLTSQRDEKAQALAQHQDALSHLRRQIASHGSAIKEKQDEVSTRQENLQAIHKNLDDQQKERLKLMDVRKDAWRKAEVLAERESECREALGKCRADVHRSMPRATAMGLRALQKIVQDEGIVEGEQYFGMVMENMTLKDPKFQIAVEVAAQNSLFHVIVDTDATAARLMKRLEDDRLGRVTFLPLNQLRVDGNTRYPPSNDVARLLQTCVEYDSKVEMAMLHVFDRKLLARSPELAAEWAEKSDMDCITLDGDLFTRKGALSGGYIDTHKSRLRAFEAQKKAEIEYKNVGADHRQWSAAANQAEQSVTTVSAEISRLQLKQTQISRMIQSLEVEINETQSQITQQKRQGERLEAQVIPSLEREISVYAADITRLDEEIGTELTASLSADDREVLSELKKIQEDLKGKIVEQVEIVEETRAERNRLESALENNLYRRREELTQINNDEEGIIGGSATSSMLQEQKRRELEDRRMELREASKETDELESKLEEMRGEEEALKAELTNAKNEIERMRTDDSKFDDSLEQAKHKAEALMGKKSLNIGKRDNYMRKIQELGSLPPDSELRSYKNRTIDQLEKDLESVNRKLKKYSHVNKKAFDQYVNFSEKRESLMERKDELDRGAEKVRELVESLDRKKDDAINRTFRGVSKHFVEVFKELVPLGSGELIMRTAMDGAANPAADEEGQTSDEDSPSTRKGRDLDSPDVGLYRGIGINVRFSAVGENYIMSQLSGGQKALVALALIFAIQRCDPAPFYIFDELDQALDSSYRQAVANLIHGQANHPDNPTQFITSTFRPELVAIAKNCYGISHQNKVSSIHYMSKNDALKFIANLMSEEEAVGDVSTTHSSRRESSSRKRRAAEAEGPAFEEGDVEAQPISTQPE